MYRKQQRTPHSGQRHFSKNRKCLDHRRHTYPWTVKKRHLSHKECKSGAQWLSGWVLDSRPSDRGFKPHRRHCVVSLSINPSLVLVQPQKNRPFITDDCWWDVKNQIKQTKQTNKQRTQEYYERKATSSLFLSLFPSCMIAKLERTQRALSQRVNPLCPNEFLLLDWCKGLRMVLLYILRSQVIISA